MLYLANASTPTVRDAMRAGLLGQMVTPREGRRPIPDVQFGGDSGRYGKGYPGDTAWYAWVGRLPREGCLFVTAPDVVGDAVATMTESLPWLPKIRALGLPAALVAQDGLELLDVPWDEFDVLFIGGTTEWKLSSHAAGLAREAKDRDKSVHMGRVNSRRRKAIAESIGCDTVDGTFLAFGPDTNLPRLLSWMSGSTSLGGDTDAR